MLLKETEKNPITGARKIMVLPLLFTADSARRENFTECDGMLVVHILYLMYGWKDILSKSLKESLASAPDTLMIVKECTTFLYIVDYKNRVVSLSHSFCARISIIRVTCKTYILTAEDSTFAAKVLLTDESRFTKTEITNIHTEDVWADVNPHAIRSHCQHLLFSINLWAGILGDCLKGPHILRSGVSDRDVIVFFYQSEVDYWNLCPSVLVFTCDFNTTVLYQITALKYEYINACSKLSRTLDWSWT